MLASKFLSFSRILWQFLQKLYPWAIRSRHLYSSFCNISGYHLKALLWLHLCRRGLKLWLLHTLEGEIHFTRNVEKSVCVVLSLLLVQVERYFVASLPNIINSENVLWMRNQKDGKKYKKYVRRKRIVLAPSRSKREVPGSKSSQQPVISSIPPIDGKKTTRSDDKCQIRNSLHSLRNCVDRLIPAHMQHHEFKLDSNKTNSTAEGHRLYNFPVPSMACWRPCINLCFFCWILIIAK